MYCGLIDQLKRGVIGCLSVEKSDRCVSIQFVPEDRNGSVLGEKGKELRKQINEYRRIVC